jgi:ribokinase
VFDVVDLLVVNASEARAAAAHCSSVAVPAEDASDGDQRRFVWEFATASGCGVVLTRGAAGALAAWQGRRWRIPTLPVDAVDTTGAGDAFVGVLAAALDAGEASQIALARAAAAAGLTCQAAGAQPAMPDAQAINRALQALPPVVEWTD